MTEEQAHDSARRNSENGYVQHVQFTPNGYAISDWYSDATVASYENGKRLS